LALFIPLSALSQACNETSILFSQAGVAISTQPAPLAGQPNAREGFASAGVAIDVTVSDSCINSGEFSSLILVRLDPQTRQVIEQTTAPGRTGRFDAALVTPGSGFGAYIFRGAGSASGTATDIVAAFVRRAAVAPTGCAITPASDFTVTAGARASLSAACSAGSGLTYQWTKSPAGAIANSTAAAITDTPQATTTYSVVISNDDSPPQRVTLTRTVTVIAARVKPVCTLATSSAAPQVGSAFTVTASCSNVFSDSTFTWSGTGTASCPRTVSGANLTTPITAGPQCPIAPTAVGALDFTISVSSPTGPTSDPITPLRVTVGARTGTLAIVASTNNQTGRAGTVLPVPLAVTVADTAGAPSAGVAVSWARTAGDCTLLDGGQTVSGANGQATNRLQLGSARVCTVAATSGNTVTFTANTEEVIVQAATSITTPIIQTAIQAPQAQLANIRSRLDQVRMGQTARATAGLRFTYNGKTLPPLSAFQVVDGDKRGRALPRQELADANNQTSPSRGADPFERWGFFAGGDIEIGKQKTVGDQRGFKLRTKGLTLGADYRFANSAILGASVGFLRGDTDLVDGAGTQDADGYSASLFGSFSFGKGQYVDAALNVGRNRYDNDRTVFRDDRSRLGSLTSNTRGQQLAISVSTGWNYIHEMLTLNPYARYEFIRATVDGFSEDTGSATTRDFAVSISQQRAESSILSIGAQVNYAASVSWGVLQPFGRLEFQRQTRDSKIPVNARLVLATASTDAVVPQAGADKAYGNFALGVNALMAKGFNAFVQWERLFGKSNYKDDKFQVQFRYTF
jgi:outer membrane autotransporter protein